MGKMKGNRLNTAANVGSFVTGRQQLKQQQQSKMKKQLTLAALAILPLAGCVVVNPSGSASDGTTAVPSQIAAPQATMVDVRGMTLDKAHDKVSGLPNFSGEVEVRYNSLAGDPTSGDRSSWIVVDNAPYEGRKIGDTVVLKVALPEAPAEKAVPLDSVIELERAVGAAGIECDSTRPASEAKYPDSSMYCLENLVLSYWNLETAKSKQYFELQKEAYIQFKKEDGPGSSTLLGPKWMMRGDDATVQKLQGTLGGTIL